MVLDVNEGLDSLYTNAEQLYQLIENIQEEYVDPVEELKAFAYLLVQTTIQILLEGGSTLNSLAGLDALTTFLEEGIPEDRDDLSEIREFQKWFADTVENVQQHKFYKERLRRAAVEGGTGIDDLPRPPSSPSKPPKKG